MIVNNVCYCSAAVSLHTVAVSFRYAYIRAPQRKQLNSDYTTSWKTQKALNEEDALLSDQIA